MISLAAPHWAGKAALATNPIKPFNSRVVNEFPARSKQTGDMPVKLQIFRCVHAILQRILVAERSSGTFGAAMHPAPYPSAHRGGFARGAAACPCAAAGAVPHGRCITFMCTRHFSCRRFFFGWRHQVSIYSIWAYPSVYRVHLE